MRSMLTVAAAAVAIAAAAAPASGAPAYPVMAQLVNEYVDSVIHMANANNYGSSAIRDAAAAAWASVHVQTPNATLVTTILDAVFERQLPDGEWPWQFDETTCMDANGVQFTSLPILRLFVEHADLLPPGYIDGKLAQLTSAANASIAEAAFEAFPYYTNIFTMRLVNLYLFAQVTGNGTIQAYADAALAAWGDMVVSAGIHEFNSPTYTAVTLANLYSGIASIRNATVASTLTRFVDFIAADAAAHYFAPARELGGAHSRDYDFLFGSAGMDWWAILSGIAGGCNPAAGNDSWVNGVDMITMQHLYVAWLRGELPQLPQALIDLACPVDADDADWRIARASYSSTPGQVTPLNGSDRYTFVSPVFSIGTASQWYGQQDKMLVAQMPSFPGPPPPPASPRSAQVTAVLDRFDSPYGEVRTPDGSGHEKPTHLQPNLAAVQDGAAALLVFDLTPEFMFEGKGSNYSSVATNVILPAGGSVDAVYANGVRVGNISTGAPTVPLPLDSTVVVRAGGAAIAARIFAVDGLAGYLPTAALQFDGPTGTDAARLTAYLYQGQNATFTPPPPTSRSAIFIAGGLASSDAEALALAEAVASAVISTSLAPAPSLTWSVTVAPAPGPLPPACPGLGSTFTAALAIGSRRIAARRVNGTDEAMPLPGALQVRWSNGTAVTITP